MSQGIGHAGQGSALLAPCDTVEPDATEACAHADFNAGFNELIDTMSPVFFHLSGGSR
jgi:L-xylulokinase